MLILGASALGYPLTEVVIRRCGRGGALFVEGVCIGLAVRDAAMIANGVPHRLRAVPALLLYLEFGSAALAALVTAPGARAHRGFQCQAPDCGIRRVSTAALFGLHTIRFAIYLMPDQGRRSLPAR